LLIVLACSGAAGSGNRDGDARHLTAASSSAGLKSVWRPPCLRCSARQPMGEAT